MIVGDEWSVSHYLAGLDALKESLVPYSELEPQIFRLPARNLAVKLYTVIPRLTSDLADEFFG